VRKVLARLSLLVLMLVTLVALPVQAAGTPTVYILPLNGFQPVDPTMALQVERAVRTAEADPDAAALVLVLDTPGGLVSSAFEIKNTLLKSQVKTIAWVENNALSAGALIAMSAEKLYMAPGSAIGAAEPRLEGTTTKADYKTVDAVVANFKAAALARGRDPAIAAAMVDTDARVPWQQGKLLVLTQQEAIDKKFADGRANSITDLLSQTGLTGYELVTLRPTTSDAVGRILTTPWVAILLLVVGVIALGMEFTKPGLTLPGVVGIAALGLFFAGNFLVGTAGWLEIGLAVIGAILLVVEIFIPGFGLFGISGLIAVGLSIFWSVPNPRDAFTYMLWTALAGSVAFALIARQFSQRGLGRWLTLQQSAKEWRADRPDRAALVGQVGETVTTLRPAGIARIGDQKVDVVTEGEFIPAGTPVIVITVEGRRIVVRALPPEQAR
jgi:membrane-bound serine protease (ClpP class)